MKKHLRRKVVVMAYVFKASRVVRWDLMGANSRGYIYIYIYGVEGPLTGAGDVP